MGNTWHTFKFKLPEAPNSKWRLPYLIYPIKYFKFYFFKYGIVDSVMQCNGGYKIDDYFIGEGL
ncbi:unnamed protein product [Trifolium pratense]|uniref:Uncharacterized protein n=1 Tax=Trifolium pratense TaxID=57577 RepID=A0ACB0L221_TRIPR|nr:unnamed protein product [Trifolium pratense]